MNTAEDIVKDKNQQILTVSFDDTVQTACEFMVKNRICLLYTSPSPRDHG